MSGPGVGFRIPDGTPSRANNAKRTINTNVRPWGLSGNEPAPPALPREEVRADHFNALFTARYGLDGVLSPDFKGGDAPGEHSTEWRGYLVEIAEALRVQEDFHGKLVADWFRNNNCGAWTGGLDPTEEEVHDAQYSVIYGRLVKQEALRLRGVVQGPQGPNTGGDGKPRPPLPPAPAGKLSPPEQRADELLALLNQSWPMLKPLVVMALNLFRAAVGRRG